MLCASSTAQTNLSFSESSFHKSVGRGLSLQDTVGHVEIKNSTFVENKVLDQDKLGIYIEFTHGTQGYPHCNPEDNIHNMNSSYVRDHVFEDNRATNDEVTAQAHIKKLTGSYENTVGHGGGIYITFVGSYQFS